jgi:hypothetical protein
MLEHLQEGRGAAVQVLFQGCQNPWAESILRAVHTNEGSAFFADAPEMVQSPMVALFLIFTIKVYQITQL